MGSEINVDIIKQEMEDDSLTRNRTNEEKEINPYQKVGLNNVYIDDVKTVQMEYWLILNDVLKYVQHDRVKNST